MEEAVSDRVADVTLGFKKFVSQLWNFKVQSTVQHLMPMGQLKPHEGNLVYSNNSLFFNVRLDLLLDLMPPPGPGLFLAECHWLLPVFGLCLPASVIVLSPWTKQLRSVTGGFSFWTLFNPQFNSDQSCFSHHHLFLYSLYVCDFTWQWTCYLLIQYTVILGKFACYV